MDSGDFFAVVIVGIFAALILIGIEDFGQWRGKKEVARECRNFGKTNIYGYMYECKPMDRVKP